MTRKQVMLPMSLPVDREPELDFDAYSTAYAFYDPAAASVISNEISAVFGNNQLLSPFQELTGDYGLRTCIQEHPLTASPAAFLLHGQTHDDLSPSSHASYHSLINDSSFLASPSDTSSSQSSGTVTPVSCGRREVTPFNDSLDGLAADGDGFKTDAGDDFDINSSFNLNCQLKSDHATDTPMQSDTLSNLSENHTPIRKDGIGSDRKARTRRAHSPRSTALTQGSPYRRPSILTGGPERSRRREKTSNAESAFICNEERAEGLICGRTFRRNEHLRRHKKSTHDTSLAQIHLCPFAKYLGISFCCSSQKKYDNRTKEYTIRELMDAYETDNLEDTNKAIVAFNRSDNRWQHLSTHFLAGKGTPRNQYFTPELLCHLLVRLARDEVIEHDELCKDRMSVARLNEAIDAAVQTARRRFHTYIGNVTSLGGMHTASVSERCSIAAPNCHVPHARLAHAIGGRYAKLAHVSDDDEESCWAFMKADGVLDGFTYAPGGVLTNNQGELCQYTICGRQRPIMHPTSFWSTETACASPKRRTRSTRLSRSSKP